MMKISETKYTESLDFLLALVSHLGTTKLLSRVPSVLAKRLGLNEDDVAEVLQKFPGIFRKSSKLSVSGEHFYTLHLRYGLRSQTDDDDESAARDPLSDAQMGLLFDFINQMYNSELQRRQQRNDSLVPVACAVIAAIAAVIAGFV